MKTNIDQNDDRYRERVLSIQELMVERKFCKQCRASEQLEKIGFRDC